MSINIRKIGRLKGIQNTTPIVKAMQGALYQALRAHFLFKNSQGNKQGWWRSNFWAQRVRDKTYIGTLTATRATVGVASPEFGHKISGGTVRPVTAKAIAIPANSDAKKLIRPALVMDSPKFAYHPIKNKGNLVGLIVETNRKPAKQSKRPLSALLDKKIIQRKPRKRKRAPIVERVMWWLYKEVTHAPDPTAEPDQDETKELINAAARTATARAFRESQKS
jgi:hypothetical protein